MNTIIKITLIFFLSIANINNFVFSQDITRMKGKGLGADYIPIYVNGMTKFIKKGMAKNCFQGSAVDLSLPGCQEHIIYNPPSCGTGFYSCSEGNVSGEIKDDDKTAFWNCVKGSDVENCEKDKEDNNDISDLCGNSFASCLNGSTVSSQNNLTNSWTCEKHYDQIESKTQNCQKITLPSVDGQCGSNKYNCTSGTADIISSSTWICRGTNGGSDDSCSYDPVVNGSCGSSTDTCYTGTFKSNFGSSWICLGENGGSTANCSNPTPILNGACGSELYTCDEGSVILKNGNDWACSGSNGGSSDYCTYSDPEPPTPTRACSGGLVPIFWNSECKFNFDPLDEGESQTFNTDYGAPNEPYGVCGQCFDGSDKKFYNSVTGTCIDGEIKITDSSMTSSC